MTSDQLAKLKAAIAAHKRQQRQQRGRRQRRDRSVSTYRPGMARVRPVPGDSGPLTRADSADRHESDDSAPEFRARVTACDVTGLVG